MSTQQDVQAHSFTAHDGVNLIYRHWPSTAVRRGAVVIVHRGQEHSSRMARLVDELGLPEFDVFAVSARGDAPSFGTVVRDLQTFIGYVTATHGIAVEEIAMLGQDIGSVIAAAWVHDYAPRIRALVLTAPAFTARSRAAFIAPAPHFVPAPGSSFFAHSGAGHPSIIGLAETAQRILTDAQAITVPTQLLISGSEQSAHAAPQHHFFERLGSPIKERHVFAENERPQAVVRLRDFLRRIFAQAPRRVDLRHADKSGSTYEEALALAEPLPLLSLRRLYWVAIRLNLKFAGLLSDGVRLGHQTGFDSGSTLDYVYRNQPSGIGPIGRLMDRQYLNAIGWRGIRQRKLNLEELLRHAIAATAGEGRPVRVLDIAAGHGRYVLEALQGAAVRPASILLRDYSDINVCDGAALIDAKRLEDIARFEKGDAFDRESLGSIAPRPTIGIVSGLYELFPGNDDVCRSLAGLAEAIEPGGYLLYTGQPWHPQLEMIARALTSHRGGNAWVMRRRTQAEMDQLVEAAGFRKLEQRIDEWGIFTVSLARRT